MEERAIAACPPRDASHEVDICDSCEVYRKKIENDLTEDDLGAQIRQ